MTGAGRGPAWGRDVASAPRRDWGQEGDVSWPAAGIFWDLLPVHVTVSPPTGVGTSTLGMWRWMRDRD